MMAEPVVPKLAKLCRASVKVATPLDLGATPAGTRRIIAIVGGTMEGDRLRGEIVPGGADWQIVREDGTALLEARYTMRTHDGALIYVRNAGIRRGRAGRPARVLLSQLARVRDGRPAVRVAERDRRGRFGGAPEGRGDPRLLRRGLADRGP